MPSLSAVIKGFPSLIMCFMHRFPVGDAIERQINLKLKLA